METTIDTVLTEKLVNRPRPIPETGFVRLQQILAVIPYGKSTWWAGVKSGRFPKPVKLSIRRTAWKAEDIHALIKRLSAAAMPHSDS
jgi:predicted DNA-binding transcriptional regulator AlpA